MSYQVLARKWRPQRFDDVVGQQAVTRTLRNAIASGRVAHAFVFAGSRGCGKTTTARILARALNCVKGPTGDPCGECDACVEIAQGRDMDVQEIDAASHTQVEKTREVILSGLAIAPVRDRYKIFIIDEVHQLSAHSFNALLKSIEEPPAHVVFIMATTELHKIPDTILSRSQVFEFRQIAAKAIADHLRTIADAERLDVPDAALALIARAAEGSMRDAQSALDQVIAFAGTSITVDDVSTVLGLVGRDLLFDLVEAVVAEDAPRAFALADRAVESGQELRLVLRELARVTRDLMIIGIDSTRLNDVEIAEGERERLKQLSGRFSREDAMRAFDLLSNAEVEIRTAAQPRYYFEMVLLRWMHLRKLVPLVDLLEQMGAGGQPARTAARPPTPQSTSPQAPWRSSEAAPRQAEAAPSQRRPVEAPSRAAAVRAVPEATAAAAVAKPAGSFKDALLGEIRARKAGFYNTVVAQAQRIEVTDNRVSFVFGAAQTMLKEWFEQQRGWLETTAQQLAGHPVTVAAIHGEGGTGPNGADTAAPAPQTPAAEPSGKRDLKAEALSSSAVQAMLDVFPAEIRDVEEM